MGANHDDATPSGVGHLSTLAQGLATPAANAQRGDASGEQPTLPLRDRERYKFLGEHARGGLGRIWRVKDKDLGRQLALKEMLEPGPVAQARFAREALTTARLEHPAIVPVHDAGRTEHGEFFYTMKLVHGASLADAVAGAKGLPERLALLPRMLSVAEAIAYAHQERVLHRDLKPSNVLVGEFGETAVIDWGLAKDLDAAGDDSLELVLRSPTGASSQLTQVGAVMGTPAYMPPEQARGETVSFAADIYALGACLRFILTGEAPYRGPDGASLLEAVKAGPPSPIAALSPDAPKDLAAIAERAMAREPKARYPSAKDFAEDLGRWLAGQRVSAHRYSLLERGARWMQRHKGATAAAMVGSVLLLVGAVVANLRETGLRQSAETERTRAEKSALVLLEQQGRSQLETGHPSRAAVYFAEALAQSKGDAVLHSLLGQSVKALAAKTHDLVGHSKDVVTVAWSPDGEHIVSGADDTSVRLWSAKTGALIRVLGQHAKPLDAVAFSADGKKAVSSGLDDVVMVFDLEHPENDKRFTEHDGYRVAFSPDGTQVLTGGQNGKIRVRDLATLEVKHELSLHTSRTQELAFAPDGSLVVPSWDRTLSVWSPGTYQRTQLFHHDAEVASVAFSADGRWAAIAEADAYVHIRSLPSWEKKHTLRMPEGARWPQVSFHQNGTVVLTRTADGVLRAWHTSSGALLATVDVQPEGKLFCSGISPDGTRLVTGGLSGRVALWSLEGVFDFQVLSFGLSHREAIFPGEWRRDGQVLATPSENGRLVLWNPQGQAIAEHDVGPYLFSIALSPPKGTLLVANVVSPHKEAKVWSVPGFEVQGGFTHPKLVHNVAASADGERYATACYDGAVRLLDAATGALQQTFKLDETRLSSVAFRPDGREVAATNGFGKVFLVDVASGKTTKSWQAHPTWIQDVEYSADGKSLVTAGRQDHQVRVWDLATGQRTLNFTHHTNNVMRASFSPDGTKVASAAVDHTAHLFEAKTGRVLRSWRGPSYTAAFSPDGQRLLTTGYDGYAVVWNLAPDARDADALVAFARERAPWKLVDGELVPKVPAE